MYTRNGAISVEICFSILIWISSNPAEVTLRLVMTDFISENRTGRRKKEKRAGSGMYEVKGSGASWMFIANLFALLEKVLIKWLGYFLVTIRGVVLKDST